MPSLDKVIWLVGSNPRCTGTEVAKMCEEPQRNISTHIHGFKHKRFFDRTKVKETGKVELTLSKAGIIYFDRLKYEYLYDAETDTRLQYKDSRSGAPR